VASGAVSPQHTQQCLSSVRDTQSHSLLSKKIQLPSKELLQSNKEIGLSSQIKSPERAKSGVLRRKIPLNTFRAETYFNESLENFAFSNRLASER
jgi:hypothetical protein